MIQCDRFSDNLTTNPQLLMIADQSLITELTATIRHAMNEQRTQTYLNLINQLSSSSFNYVQFFTEWRIKVL
ncbi:MAG: hypothetical protein IM496_14635 [Microcystis sp. M049S2]|uniref:hypothetical protein n=1 Tax=Microcystis sp. M049S2 TaxID=2771169 RepID=UPI00258E95F3|nr:hypothetical protein [Microcystis sp. M049S2]MCA2659687.1 hypothetical protein [Microcystis sp. M049S2]